jgi:hypothetical protein
MKKMFALLVALSIAVPAFAADPTPAFQTTLDSLNGSLAAEGEGFRVLQIEWMTSDEGDGAEAGNTVFAFNVGNKQLGADYVPFDPRRSWNISDTISYLVDQGDGATNDGLTNAQTEAAIDRAMTTWDLATTCSAAPMVKAEDTGVDADRIDFLLGFGAPGGEVADLVHAGWVPAGIFPNNVIGVTFTLVWVDGGGNATDINQDGKSDVAWREIFYNDVFAWAIDGNIDVETVALHEAGHGLSQGHFGQIFITNSNGKLHFSPRAVMNAAYGGVIQNLTGTDLSGHCSIWGDWPNQ